MAKTKEQKKEMVLSLQEKVDGAKSAVLFNYKGLKVKEIEELRRNLREKGVEVGVVKNTLLKIVLKQKGIEIANEDFDKPMAVAFGHEDEVAAAKEISGFAKKHEALEVLGGILENKMISASAVNQLAQLPSREELYAKLVGSIASPLSGLVNVMSGNIRGLVNVINAYKDKKAV